MNTDVIIIGAGQAGSMAAISLRKNNYKGSILVIGEEKYLPYQRPPLSKGFLSGEVKLDNLYFKSGEYYSKNNIQIKYKTVTKIDKSRNLVVLKEGKKLDYKKLIIATGSELNKLNIDCSTKNLLYLRTVDDSIKIKSILNTKKSLAIIGAGYIGLEIAAAAISKGLKVSVIEMEDRIMSRSVSQETAEFFQKKHEERGVNFHFNSSVLNIEDIKNKKKIICNDGTAISSDAVVIGVGIKPNIQLAIDAGLDCNDGIMVNEYGQTSDKDIFAAGDCTNHPNKLMNKRIRLESVHNAVEQAKTVASSIINKNQSYHQVPWFWSDQYDLKLQIAGISKSYEQLLIEGSMKDEKFSVYYIKNKRVIAIDAINNQKTFIKTRRLIALAKEIPQEILINNFVGLEDWIINGH